MTRRIGLMRIGLRLALDMVRAVWVDGGAGVAIGRRRECPNDDAARTADEEENMSDEELEECVALAMYKERALRAPAGITQFDPSWDECSSSQRMPFVFMARAAIRAVKSLTRTST
jgi:hypothetical protein